MHVFWLNPNFFLLSLENFSKVRLALRKPMPITRGTNVSQINSNNISMGGILTDAAKINETDHGIVNTPSRFVIVVNNTARDTLPFAWVTMVTPEDNVVGTTQKTAIPSNNVMSTRPLPKTKIGQEMSGVTPSTRIAPKVKAFGCKLSETESKHNPLTMKMITTANCGIPSVPNLMLLTATPGAGKMRPNVITHRRPMIKKFLINLSLSAMAPKAIR
mmetsp:Transcript_119319/g.234391  ORF Transcript_119319/g.234391 Transcript_119319/m.234391 type:complete len:217 (-) Transcript_119319:50-700(-)